MISVIFDICIMLKNELFLSSQKIRKIDSIIYFIIYSINYTIYILIIFQLYDYIKTISTYSFILLPFVTFLRVILPKKFHFYLEILFTYNQICHFCLILQIFSFLLKNLLRKRPVFP